MQKIFTFKSETNCNFQAVMVHKTQYVSMMIFSLKFTLSLLYRTFLQPKDE